MKKSNGDAPSEAKPKRGRPVTTGKGFLIGVRILPNQLARLDEWIEQQPEPKPSRPEAIRQILASSIGLLPKAV